MAEVTTVNVPQGDDVTTTLNGAVSAGATSFTIGTGLNLDANGGFLQINYDSTAAIGVSDGPECIAYTSYITGTGAVSGVTRAQAGTTAVSHSSGSTVMCGSTAKYLMNGNVLGLATVIANQTGITAAVDLTNLAVTVTVPAGGRRVRLSAQIQCSSGTADNIFTLTIQEGATVLQTASLVNRVISTNLGLGTSTIITPTAASHTYKLVGAAGNSSQLSAAATYPAYLLVELL